MKKDYIKGSITIEAAFILPVCIYTVVLFLFFFQVLNFQQSLYYGMLMTGKHASEIAHIYNDLKDESKGKEKKEEKAFVNKILTGVYFYEQTSKYIDTKRWSRSCIKGGYNGVSFASSQYLKNNNYIDMIADYYIDLSIPYFAIKPIKIRQRVRTRGFVGADDQSSNVTDDNTIEKNDETEKVYITVYGTVYHRDRNCSHIRLSIEKVSIEMVDKLRNESGGIYKKCQLCIRDNQNLQTVYIAKNGDKYHKSLSCSGLKRIIICISINDVGDHTPCQRCIGSGG